MSMEPLYLRANVQVEPLIDQWYAWPHLIPPTTAARNLTERHLKIMQSYIANPKIHASAVKNPKMLGGPFIDYDGKRVSEIDRLLRDTVTRRADLVQLSSDIGELDRMLQKEAMGKSLHDLYRAAPESLRGYVELVYDLNNHPAFRLIEPLLYRSKFYQKRAQSIMMSTIQSDGRPFVMSTPRLESEDILHLKLPFDHDAIDYLFKLKKKPQVFDEIAERCGVESEDEKKLLCSFLSPLKPAPYVPYQGSGMRWRYFGHACILLETSSVAMLFDPVLSYTYESGISRYTYDDLPDVLDYVLITHNHQDHVLFETLLQLRHKTRCIVVPRCGGGALQDPSLKLILENIGFKNVVELDELEKADFAGGTITGLPFLGEHSDLNIRTKLAYLVEVANNRLLFAADSCNIEPMLYSHVVKLCGKIRALFLGMECDGAPLSWLYGPLLTKRIDRVQDESRRLSGCNYEQAQELIDRCGCTEVFVYAMGQEPWLNYIMSLKYTPESNPIIQSNRILEMCRERGLIGERLFGEREMLLD